MSEKSFFQHASDKPLIVFVFHDDVRRPLKLASASTKDRKNHCNHNLRMIAASLQ